MAKYKVTENYMVRTPVLPIELYKEVYLDENEEKKLIELTKNPVIQEIISISSPDLRLAIDNLENELDSKKRNQILTSFSRYINRSSTRTTPYGLCAGVTTGSLSDYTNLELSSLLEFKKATRPDMEWLLKVISDLEKDQSILNTLVVQKNKLAYAKGVRVEIPYISNFGSTDNESGDVTATIRRSRVVERVLEISANGVIYADLVNMLVDENKGVSIEVIQNFLNQLIVSEFLLTDLRPQLGSENVLEDIIKKITRVGNENTVITELKVIATLIKNYNSTKIGFGESLYKNIVQRMKKIHDGKNVLQVDMSIEGSNLVIDKDIVKNIEELINLATKLPVKKSFKHLSEYIEIFAEVYGFGREVKLLDALDTDTGIGYPATYSNPLSMRTLKDTGRETDLFEKVLKDKYIKAIKFGESEIVLSKEDFKDINDENKSFETPNSLEVYAIPKMNKGNMDIYLSPGRASNGAGKTLGRFGYFLKDKASNILSEINTLEEKLDDTLLVELRELPQSGRLSNVSMSISSRCAESNIGTIGEDGKNQIDIADIYMCAEFGESEPTIYFKSKKYNKRLKFVKTNMLNIMLYSNIGRFLIEGSAYNETEIAMFFQKCELGEFDYKPQIRYKNIILTPEMWALKNKDLESESLDKKIASFKAWMKKWNVPSLVYLVNMDNRLLFNLNSDFHIKELLLNFKKDDVKEIRLTRFEGEFGDEIIKSDEGARVGEFIFNLVKVSENDEKKQPRYSPVLDDDASYKKRSFILGDEWIYFKIYGGSKRKEDFIGDSLYRLYNQLLDKKYINKFFFLRYADPDYHVRIRFRLTDIENLGETLIIINKWAHELIEDGVCNKLIFDTYERELERYGGVERIECAEEVFWADSIYVMELIRLMKIEGLDISDDNIHVIGVINILEELGLSFREQADLFYRYFDKNKYRDEFKPLRRELMKVANAKNNWSSLRDLESGEKLFSLFDIRKDSLSRYFSIIKEMGYERDSIILSVIHMYCNRNGLSRDKEKYVMQLVRHTLQSLEYIHKKK